MYGKDGQGWFRHPYIDRDVRRKAGARYSVWLSANGNAPQEGACLSVHPPARRGIFSGMPPTTTRVPLHHIRDKRHAIFLPAMHIAYLRSEEHTSELQSRENLVCRLLLEKK